MPRQIAHFWATILRTVARLRRRHDSELADELASHLQMHIDDNMRTGMNAGEARRAALLALGGMESVKEAYRDRQGFPWLEHIWQDLRFGLRSFVRTPGFTAAATLVLALGVGANTAIFSVVHAALLRPLPIRDDARVAVVWIDNAAHGRTRVGPAGQDYLDWMEQDTAFEELFLFEHGSGTITGEREAEQVRGLRVTTNFASFLGIRPVLGRAFESADSTRNVMLMSSSYWRTHFDADASVIGRALTLNGVPYEVIGVLPTDACFWYPADVVVPWPIDRLRIADSNLGVFGRLRPAATFASAQAAMNAVAARISEARPDERRGWGITVVPIRDVAVQYIRLALDVLLVGAGLVLLVACANVASLLVARTIGRRQEFAIRTALGASHVRLVQQFLVESLLLGLAGGALGLLAAHWGTAGLLRIMPATIPVPAAASQVPLPRGDMDTAALAFTLAVSLLSSVIFGLGVALPSVRRQPADDLKDGARTAGTRSGRPQRALVIVEMALAVVLLVGSGLMIQSFWQLLVVKPGFDPDHLVTAQLKFADDAPGSKYRERAARVSAIEAFLDRVRAVPSVEAAAFAMILPLSQDDQDVGGFVIAERPRETLADRLTADFRIVTADYFRTMRIPLRAGRPLAASDTADSARVVVIDETLSRVYFGPESPIGRHVQIPGASSPPREIVGVVGAVLDDGLDKESRPTIYIPYPQAPAQVMSLVVRTAADPETVLPTLRQAIFAVDPDEPLFNVRRMRDVLSNTISAEQLTFVLLSLFAGLALTLAAVGIYSVTSSGVRQRTREIGVRMALGADRADVLTLIIGEGMRRAFIGTTVGLIAAAGLTHLLSSLLFRVAPLDVTTFLAVAIGCSVVAFIANGIPAWRAVRTEPVAALSGR
jgi:putative ABC transport system permease protein